MPIQAQTSDGTMHEFPDGTPGAVIDKAMADYTASIDESKPNNNIIDQTTGMTPETLKHAAVIPQIAAKGAPILGAAVPDSEDTKRFEKDQPGLTTAFKGVGGALTMAPAMLAAPELFGINAAQGLVGNALTSGAVNAGIGAADAAARGEPIVEGAVTGGLAGAAVPVVGKGLGAAFTGIAKLLTPEATGVLEGINKLALEKASTAARASGLSEADIANMINTKGPQAFLMEYTPEMFGQGTGIVSRAGNEGKNAILQAYEKRGAPEAIKARIDKGINEGLGEPVNMTQASLENAAARKKEAGPLFEQFRSMKVHPTEDVKTLTGQLDELGYLKDARRIAKEEAAATGKPVEPTENFFTTGDQKDWPTTRSWSYVKQAVDEKIANSYDAHGIPTQATRRLRELKGRIDSVIGDSSPETKKVWDEARGIWESSKALDNARAEGSRVWNPNYSKDQLFQDLTDMSTQERQAFKEGARAALAEKAGQTVNGDANVAKMLRADNNKEKFTFLSLKKGYKPDSFLDELDHMAKETSASKALGTNAEKEAIAEGSRQMTANPKDLAVNKAAELYSMHVTPLKVPLSPIGKFMERRQISKYEDMRNALGKLYTKQGPEAQEIARALLNYKTGGAGGPQLGQNTSAIINSLARPSVPGAPVPFLPPSFGGTNHQ